MASGIGIDIGNDSIKIVRVALSRGKVSVTGALKIPRRAAEISTEKAGDGVQGSIPLDLGSKLKAAKFATSGACGVTGREYNLKYLSVPPVPPDKLRMLLSMELGGKLSTGKAQLEDGPALTYAWRLLNVPAGLKSDLSVIAGIAKTDYLMGLIETFKKAGIDAETLTPSSFGLINAYLSTQTIPAGETVVLCDVGHELLEIAILEEGNVYFARSAAGGGKKFNLSLDKILQTGAERATIFKHERARIYPEGAEMRNKQDENFQPALREGADVIAAAIRNSVMFCRTQAKLPKLDFNRVYLSGGGARLKGLCDYLEKKLSRPVQPLNISAGVALGDAGPEAAKLFDGAISEMTVALGLAIIDAKPDAIAFKLVPEPILVRRSFWRKTVVGAAAGVLLIASLVPPYLYSQRSKTEAEQSVKLFEDKVKSVATEKKEYAKFIEKKKILAAKADYYARQTRLDHVYVELLRVIRASTPPEHVMLTYIGPDVGEAGTVAGVGSWNPVEKPVDKIVIRGAYEKDAYPDSPTPPLITINDAWLTKIRPELLKVPGVVQANLVANADIDPIIGAQLEKAGKKAVLGDDPNSRSGNTLEDGRRDVEDKIVGVQPSGCEK